MCRLGFVCQIIEIVGRVIMEEQVYARHSCRTKYLAHVNTLLTDVQKTFIQRTPFGWLLSIDVEAKMSRTLLIELCSRWLERRDGFEVRSFFIPFTKLDVCLCLGVRVNGDMFKLFKEQVDCYSRRLFDTNDVTIHHVYEELQMHRCSHFFEWLTCQPKKCFSSNKEPTCVVLHKVKKVIHSFLVKILLSSFPIYKQTIN